MSTLSITKYGLFIYNQQPVINANTLRKNGFYDFPILFVLFDLLNIMCDLQKVETKERPKQFSCYCVFLTANTVILLLYTIITALETHPLVLKAQRNRLG